MHAKTLDLRGLNGKKLPINYGYSNVIFTSIGHLYLFSVVLFKSDLRLGCFLDSQPSE